MAGQLFQCRYKVSNVQMYRMKKTRQTRWRSILYLFRFDFGGQFTSGNILMHFIVNVHWPRDLLSWRMGVKQDVYFPTTLSLSRDHKYEPNRRRISYLCFPEFNHSLIYVSGLWYATHYSYVSEEQLFPVCKLLIEWHICSASCWTVWNVMPFVGDKKKCTTVM